MRDTSSRLLASVATAFESEGVPLGGTVAVDGGTLPVTGYFVGGMAPGLVYEGLSSVRGPEVAEYVDGATTDYVGWWVDMSDGRVYVDMVEWHGTESAARARGREFHEIAVWDIARSREIRLEGER